jgi:hypothetical protein
MTMKQHLEGDFNQECPHGKNYQIHPALSLGGLTFVVTDTWKQVQEWWDECPEYNELRKQLDEPSGLEAVVLVRRHYNCPLDVRYRLLDFTGTTVREAILRILRFYTHKTFRREIGGHTFFQGVFIENNIQTIPLFS